MNDNTTICFLKDSCQSVDGAGSHNVLALPGIVFVTGRQIERGSYPFGLANR